MSSRLLSKRTHVLTEYTRDKRIKELKGATERAQADELASKEVYDLELSKEKRLERELQACTMVAPRDGKVVYYEGSKPRISVKPDGSTAPWPYIEVGEWVQYRQLLFKIVPVTETAAEKAR